MTTNEGGLDRALRVVAGLVLLALTLNGSIGLWGWLGLVPLATGVVGWCPLYRLLGWNTGPTRQGKA